MPLTGLVVAFFAPRLSVVVPLFIACLFVLLSIPITSRRGKLSIPACVGIGLGAAALAWRPGHFWNNEWDWHTLASQAEGRHQANDAIRIHQALLTSQPFLDGEITTNLLDRIGSSAFLAAAARA